MSAGRKFAARESFTDSIFATLVNRSIRLFNISMLVNLRPGLVEGRNKLFGNACKDKFIQSVVVLIC